MIKLLDEFGSIGEVKRAANSPMQMLDEYDASTLAIEGNYKHPAAGLLPHRAADYGRPLMAATGHRHMPGEAARRGHDGATCLGLPGRACWAPLFERHQEVAKPDDDTCTVALARSAGDYPAANVMRVRAGAQRWSAVEDRLAADKADAMRPPPTQGRRKRVNGGAAP